MRCKVLGLVLAIMLTLSGTVVPMSAQTINGTNSGSRLVGQDHYQISVQLLAPITIMVSV